MYCACLSVISLFFNASLTPLIYTLSLHDALPIFSGQAQLQDGYARSAIVDNKGRQSAWRELAKRSLGYGRHLGIDRKSTRLNSSHLGISYAVFCLKKKKKKTTKVEI